MKSAIVLSLIGIGFLLLVASGLWVSFFPGTSTWTVEKNDRWSEVKDKMHNLSFAVGRATPSMHSGPETGTAKEELDQLKEEYELLNREFQSAYDRPRTISTVLKWSGITLALLGVIGWYAVKQAG